MRDIKKVTAELCLLRFLALETRQSITKLVVYLTGIAGEFYGILIG